MAATLVGRAQHHFLDRTNTRILELGCGTGRMTRQLARAFPQAQITALDLAPEMIAHARSTLPGIDFRVADAEAYVQEDGNAYALVVTNAAAQWFEDPGVTLACARARLATDGLLAISTFGDQTFRELRHAFGLAYAASGLAAVEHVVPMRSAEDWRRDFPDAEIVEQTVLKVFPDVKAFLRSVQEAGAVNALSGRRFLSRCVLRKMIERYTAQYGVPEPGGIVATYHIIYVYCAA